MADQEPWADLHFEKLADGIPGCEGPLVTSDGTLYVVEPGAGVIWKVLKNGEKEFFANTSGIPAGLQLDRDGSIWVADMKRGILRVDLKGEQIDAIASRVRDQPMPGCNDLVFDSRGNLYFTAPGDSSLDKAHGEIYCRLTSGELRRLDGSFAFCNGLAISSDDRFLIIAETMTMRLHAYSLAEPGRIVSKHLFATLPGYHMGGPDGLEFDAEGHLIATNWGGRHLEVYSPDGTLIRRVALPFDRPSNVQFFGPGSDKLIITEHTNNAVWQCDWPCAGQMQYGWG